MDELADMMHSIGYETFDDLIEYHEGNNYSFLDMEDTTSDTQMFPPLDGCWGYSQQSNMTAHDPGELTRDNSVGKVPQQPTSASTLDGFSHEHETDMTSFGPVTPKVTQELAEAPMATQEQSGTTNTEQQHMHVLHHELGRDTAHSLHSVGNGRKNNKPKKLKKYQQNILYTNKEEQIKIMNAKKAKENREKKKQEMNKLRERHSRSQEKLKEKDLEITRLTQKMNQDNDRLSQTISFQSQEINRLKQEIKNENQEKNRLSQENNRLSQENNRLSQEIIRFREYKEAALLNLERQENNLLKKLLS